ncbi:alkaline phosphatase family protein, partial [Ancylostoma duodenale]
VLMGGGAHNLLSKSRGGRRRDGRDIDIEWSELGGKRRVLRSVNDLQGVTASDEKLLGIFANTHLPMYLDELVLGTKTVPRLAEMTAKAIEQLQHGEKGFFLMVEGGLIDVAEHQNVINAAFTELYEFEEAIRKARTMTDPSDTLIIVTADHDHAVTLPGYLPVSDTIIRSSITNYTKGEGAGLYEVPGVLFVGGPGFDGDGLKITEDKLAKKRVAGPDYRPPTAVPMSNGPHGGVDVGVWADGPFAE